MAAEQDNKELSMAEILASIKKILAENEPDEKGMLPEEGKKIPQISLPQREEKDEIDVQTVSAAFGEALNERKPFAVNDKAAERVTQMPYATIAPQEEKDSVFTQASTDVSDEIINSFTRMFEQNDFRRQAEQPQFDADVLLRQIVNQAVAEKLDNKFLQNTVKETIIPVLEEWLSHYLPQLVAEEVERVLVKTGKH